MKPELLSPAGSYEAAIAAFQYGADAIYLGLPQFSARAEAQNITWNELALIRAYAQSFTPAKKIYITFNTLLYNQELEDAFRMLSLLEEFQPDGVIVQDFGIIRLISSYFPSIPLHASTQMAAHNLDSVLALKDLGFERVVLARELSLKEIEYIVENCGTEIEIFIHGALCYSYSGLCLFSSCITGRSGNRGRCAYCCRHPFTYKSKESHPFSMKDMALLPILDKIVETGAHSLKIEGRMKSPLYVACVTNAYRRKLDGDLSPEEEKKLTEDIQTIFSRPWTTLYSESTKRKPDDLIDALTVGHRGTQIGEISAVRRDAGKKTHISFQTSRSLEKFDGIQIDIPGMPRPYGFSIRNMHRSGDKKNCISVPAGSKIEIEVSDRNPPLIQKGAQVYCSSSQDVQQRYRTDKIRPSDFNTGIPVTIEATITSRGILLTAESATTVDKAEHFEKADLEPARNSQGTKAAVQKACSRLGETEWCLHSLKLNDPQGLYVPPALMNQARRSLIEKLDACKKQRLTEIHKKYSQAVKNRECASTAALKPEFTLKIHISGKLPPSDELERFSRIVIEIDHSEYNELINKIEKIKSELTDKQEILISTPLINRMQDLNSLCDNIELLIKNGYCKWECADLAAYRVLKKSGINPLSADWTLYALNREASAELREMGFESHVTSPELELENIYPADGESPAKEFLVYQHTPLYISASQPLTDTATDESLQIKSGSENMTVYRRGKEWVTISARALNREREIEQAQEKGISRFRVDYSWDSR